METRLIFATKSGYACNFLPLKYDARESKSKGGSCVAKLTALYNYTFIILANFLEFKCLQGKLHYMACLNGKLCYCTCDYFNVQYIQKNVVIAQLSVSFYHVSHDL